MSKQIALSFINKVNGDPALLQQVKALNGNMTALISMADKAGFGFSARDWTDVMADLERASTGELGEHDLEKVAGGNSYSESPTAVELPAVKFSFSWGGSFCVTGEH
ncbi:MAG TPA: Nif11-like leader peptide family RiPP precursor [Aggregatilineales bacterium]|nr:Nif11-like leader peptide family RiPP precursor [Aggregatilineales bacterium]